MISSLPETASFSEFATIANFKPSYVPQLRKAGRLVLTEDGKRVRVIESLQLIKDTLDPSKAGVAKRHAAEREAARQAIPQESHQESPESSLVAPDAGTSQFQSARAQREHWASLTAKLEYEKSIGKLLDAADVEATVAEAITVLRSRLEQLADTLAPQLAPVSDEARIHALMTDEVEAMLSELSRKFGTVAKGVE